MISHPVSISLRNLSYFLLFSQTDKTSSLPDISRLLKHQITPCYHTSLLGRCNSLLCNGPAFLHFEKKIEQIQQKPVSQRVTLKIILNIGPHIGNLVTLGDVTPNCERTGFLSSHQLPCAETMEHAIFFCFSIVAWSAVIYTTCFVSPFARTAHERGRSHSCFRTKMHVLLKNIAKFGHKRHSVSIWKLAMIRNQNKGTSKRVKRKPVHLRLHTNKELAFPGWHV